MCESEIPWWFFISLTLHFVSFREVAFHKHTDTHTLNKNGPTHMNYLFLTGIIRANAMDICRWATILQLWSICMVQPLPFLLLYESSAWALQTKTICLRSCHCFLFISCHSLLLSFWSGSIAYFLSFCLFCVVWPCAWCALTQLSTLIYKECLLHRTQHSKSNIKEFQYFSHKISFLEMVTGERERERKKSSIKALTKILEII